MSAKARILAVALALTLLNAAKPVHVDDTTYISFAKEIAAHPLDPYGFEVFWAGASQPANHVLAPPVFLYGLAPAVRLFGESPVLWKLWIFPLHLVLAVSVERLARRFARGLEGPLVFAIVLSPSVLPGTNLMLDVPALALALAAVAIFLEACDRESLGLALLAGVVCGLATETKYTGATAGAAILACALSSGKKKLGLFAGLAAALVFFAVEGLVSARYGESHFLANLGNQPQTLLRKIRLLKALPRIVGGALPFLPVFVLPGLDVKLGKTKAAGLAAAACFFALIVFPESASQESRELFASGVFLVLGISVLVALGFACCKLLSSEESGPLDRFLVAWLVVEALGAIVLSPFPAMRRVVPFAAVGMLVAGRLAARAKEKGELSATAAAAATVLVSLLVFHTDTLEALAQRNAVLAAKNLVSRQEKPGKVWFTGHWGFQYYAEQAGMQPLLPGKSSLEKGDLVVEPVGIYSQDVRLDPAKVDRFAVSSAGLDEVPLATLSSPTESWCYYAGKTALEPHRGPRLTVNVYRVLEDFVPESGRGEKRD